MNHAKAAILVTVATLALGGCTTDTKTHISREGGDVPFHQHPQHDWWHYKFVYYPKQQVYFEPYTHTYYWFADGQWEQGPKLPPMVTLPVADARTVRLRFERPYLQHLSVLRAEWPWDTPLPGSLEDYHFSAEGIAMTEQRELERAGLTDEAIPTGGFFAVQPDAEPAMDEGDFIQVDEPVSDELYTTADPGLETGGMEP